VEEAYKVFESVLEVHGFTTVPAGKVIKVVPSVEARQKSVELRKGPEFVPRPDDRIITQIIPLLYANAQEVRKLLAPMVSKQVRSHGYADHHRFSIKYSEVAQHR
jgi:general secretion pathway protein D